MTDDRKMMETVRRPHRGHALVLALLAMFSLAACGGADEDVVQATAPAETSTSPPSSTPSPAPGEEDVTGSDGTPILITFGDQQLTGRHRTGPGGTTPGDAHVPRSQRGREDRA